MPFYGRASCLGLDVGGLGGTGRLVAVLLASLLAAMHAVASEQVMPQQVRQSAAQGPAPAVEAVSAPEIVVIEMPALRTAMDAAIASHPTVEAARASARAAGIASHRVV